MLKNSKNMATTINATRTAQRAFPLKEWLNAKSKSLNLWLDKNSKFYSRVCELSITRRLVIQLNTIFLCIIGAAIAVEQQPLFSTIAIAYAGWLVYRLNKSDKKGGAQ